MATTTINLTDAIVRHAEPTGKRDFICDGKEAGLQLQITPNGVKTFYLRKKYKGTARRFLLGDADTMTVKRAREEARNVKVMLSKGIDPLDVKKAARSEYSMEELFKLYLENKNKLSTKTILGYMSEWNNNLQPKFGNKKISDITTEQLQNYHRRYSQKAPYAANRYIALIKAMFNYAIVHGFYHNVNPATLVKLNSEEPRIRALEKDEIGRFLTALQNINPTHRDIISILLFTGARKSNVFSMRWEDLDLSAKVWIIPKTKTDVNVRIALSDAVVDILKSRLDIKEISPWVFPANTNCGHITYLKKTWKKLLKTTGIQNLRIHDLRHTLATRLIADGVNTFIVQRVLTHKSIQSTQVYVNLNVEDLRNPVNTTIRNMQSYCLQQNQV